MGDSGGSLGNELDDVRLRPAANHSADPLCMTRSTARATPLAPAACATQIRALGSVSDVHDETWLPVVEWRVSDMNK